jgi:hypothetical protein
MTILGLVDSLDGLPEDVKKHYSPTEDGKFVADVTALTSALEAQKNKVTQSKNSVAAMEAEFTKYKEQFTGVDINEYQELQKLKLENDANKKNAAEELAKKTGDFTKIKENLVLDYEAKLAEKTKELSNYEDKFKKLDLNRAQAEVKSELSSLYSAKGIDKPYMIEHYVNSRVKTVRDEEGTIQTVILGTDGQPLEDKFEDGKMRKASLSDLVSEIASDDKWAYARKANPMGGPDAGSSQGAQSSSAPKVMSRDEVMKLNSEEFKETQELINQGKLTISD